MKKIIFSLAALMVVAMTAFTFTSCSKDDGVIGGVLGYTLSSSGENNIQDRTVWGQIQDAYTTQFKKISGAEVGSSTIQFAYGSSEATYTPKVKAACEAAEAYILENIEHQKVGRYNYSVVCINTGATIYSKTWGE